MVSSPRVKLIRKRFGFSIKELADRLDVSAPQLSRIENGKRPLTSDIAQTFEAVLQVNQSWLLGEGSDIWTSWPLDHHLLGKIDRIAHLQKEINWNRGELCWIANQIQLAWSVSNTNAMAKWVGAIVQCIEKLLRFEPVNFEELENYLHSTMPPGSTSGVLLKDRPLHMLPKLLSQKVVPSSDADYLARCFVVLVRDAVYRNNEFSGELMQQIYELLHPWCFYVLRAAENFKEYSPPVDFSRLSMQRPAGRMDFKRNNMIAVVNLSPDFTAKISIGDRIFVNCDAYNLHGLYDALKDPASRAEWYWKPENKGYLLSRTPFPNGIAIYLNETELKDLEGLLDEILNQGDIQIAAVHDIAEKKGAV